MRGRDCQLSTLVISHSIQSTVDHYQDDVYRQRSSPRSRRVLEEIHYVQNVLGKIYTDRNWEIYQTVDLDRGRRAVPSHLGVHLHVAYTVCTMHRADAPPTYKHFNHICRVDSGMGAWGGSAIATHFSTSGVVVVYKYSSGPEQGARAKRLSFVCPSSSEPRGSEALTEFIQGKGSRRVICRTSALDPTYTDRIDSHVAR